MGSSEQKLSEDELQVQVQKLLAEADSNNDGKIDFDEFGESSTL